MESFFNLSLTINSIGACSLLGSVAEGMKLWLRYFLCFTCRKPGGVMASQWLVSDSDSLYTLLSLMRNLECFVCVLELLEALVQTSMFFIYHLDLWEHGYVL